MIKLKTISGHYDTVYSIEHNNRSFIPKNVDVRRTPWNYNCVAAGEQAYLNNTEPFHISEFWTRYKDICDLYWQNYSIVQIMAYQQYHEHLEYMRRYSRSTFLFPHNPVEAFITLLLLPLIVPCGIYLTNQQQKEKREWERFKEEKWLQDMYFKANKMSLRGALYAHDQALGSRYLHNMDRLVAEMVEHADKHSDIVKCTHKPSLPPSKFATLEEIYDKLYEPSFQEFQAKQRPCRRYKGSYLEQIREGQKNQIRKKQQTRNARSRKTAEAIELVFGIGNMDNTGYTLALSDAKQAEELLKDFCDHLLENPKMCCITTRELHDPNWSPPFNNGLIVLNLTVHADEATPGVHLTCIPYSRNCSRGPVVQASLGRAMTGMGYPSTWKDRQDGHGQKIPKKNKNGEIIYNKDGTIRYQQEPDQQGIIDWIEEQKRWLQKEMKQRYEWHREYKGAHPRGNLPTPDYQAARAKERQDEYQRLLNESLEKYDERIYELSLKLDNSVERQWKNASNQDIIEQYLAVCPDEAYQQLVNKASDYLSELAIQEQKIARDSLLKKIQLSEEKQRTVKSSTFSESYDTLYR